MGGAPAGGRSRPAAPARIKITARRGAGSCAAGAARLKLGADWLDVPEPAAALLRQHLRDRSNMTTAANPASPWLFPGQFAGEHRSYRRLVRVLHQLGIPAPGEPAGRLARTRPRGTTRGPRRRARCLARHSDAPRVPRRRLLVRLRRSKTCSHPGRQDVVAVHRDAASPSSLERACNIRRSVFLGGPIGSLPLPLRSGCYGRCGRLLQPWRQGQPGILHRQHVDYRVCAAITGSRAALPEVLHAVRGACPAGCLPFPRPRPSAGRRRCR